MIELGCEGAENLEILGVTDLTAETDNGVVCIPHPVKGDSFVACFLPEVSQEEVLFDFVTLASIDFLCSADTKVGVVGEATIWPESELECNASADPQISAVSVEYIDLGADPLQLHGNFTCPGAEDFLELESLNISVCASSAFCQPAMTCLLPESSAIQTTPIPTAAFVSSLGGGPSTATTGTQPGPSPALPRVPSPTAAAEVSRPSPTNVTLNSVDYRATILQLSDDGCSGFEPIVELECTNGATLSIRSVLSFTDFEPTCLMTGSSLARCTFATINEATLFDDGFSVQLDIGFKCLGGQEPIGEARILQDFIQCPDSDASVGTATSLRYLDIQQLLFVDAFSCAEGSIVALDSGRNVCIEGGTCLGGTCLVPSTEAQQNSPIPAAAILNELPPVSSPDPPSGGMGDGSAPIGTRGVSPATVSVKAVIVPAPTSTAPIPSPQEVPIQQQSMLTSSGTSDESELSYVSSSLHQTTTVALVAVGLLFLMGV